MAENLFQKMARLTDDPDFRNLIIHWLMCGCQGCQEQAAIAVQAFEVGRMAELQEPTPGFVPKVMER